MIYDTLFITWLYLSIPKYTIKVQKMLAMKKV